MTSKVAFKVTLSQAAVPRLKVMKSSPALGLPADPRARFLVAFSLKWRGLCPPCGAERAAELAAFLSDEVVEDVGHEEQGFHPGVVSVVQTFGDRANFHPHVHALVTQGGWTGSREWVPVPCGPFGSAPGLLLFGRVAAVPSGCSGYRRSA